MIIDGFSHIMPRAVYDELSAVHPTETIAQHDEPYFRDVERRLADMDEFGIDKQVLTLASPPSWLGIDPADALPVVRLANNRIRAIADDHPDRFIPVATLPFLDGPYLDELSRCLEDLDMAGVQIFSHVDGTPLDAAAFRPFFDAVDDAAAPVWMHPQLSPYSITGGSMFYDKVFGWLFDTTIALSRLVFSGVVRDHPNLHLISHHAGAMVPHFAERINTFYEARGFYPHSDWADLDTPVSQYFERFYGDTVLNGSVSALQCSVEFFGPDHMVFASDYPYGPDHGRKWLGDLAVVRDLTIDDAGKEQILGGTLHSLLA